jgi:AbiV family abortive infection protein
LRVAVLVAPSTKAYRMTNYEAPKKDALDASIVACISNGERLLDDASYLELADPPSSRLVLVMIAQEEFAKALLLVLVREGIIPWTGYLLRAMNNHACKHLVGIIMEYVEPEWESDDDIKRIVREEAELGARLPSAVGSALNILRHEKIGRWESNNWVWAEEPEYDRAVEGVAEGARDRIKQDALYVRLSRDASVASIPTSVTSVDAEVEVSRARRYLSMVRQANAREAWPLRTYDKVVEGFRALFRK